MYIIIKTMDYNEARTIDKYNIWSSFLSVSMEQPRVTLNHKLGMNVRDMTKKIHLSIGCIFV